MDTFFTPWHGILYSGLLFGGLVPIVALIRTHRHGAAWQGAIAPGYGLSLLGIPLFIGGGLFDLVWHSLFGIEVSTEALLSPSHLILALAGALIVAGPLRAALRRDDERGAPSWPSRLAVVLSLSLTYLLSLFTFFTAFVQPFHLPLAAVRSAGEAVVELGVASVLVQAAMYTGFILFGLLRCRLPAGSITPLLTVNVALQSVLHDEYRLIPVALGAGIAADLLLAWLRPSAGRVRMLRLFAFLTPVVLYLLYFLVLGLTQGVAWSIHLWLGATVLAGVVGLLLSYCFVPPAQASTAPDPAA